MVQVFDIVTKIVHRPSENRLNGAIIAILWYSFGYWNLSGDDTANFKVIELT